MSDQEFDFWRVEELDWEMREIHEFRTEEEAVEMASLLVRNQSFPEQWTKISDHFYKNRSATIEVNGVEFKEGMDYLNFLRKKWNEK